MSELNFSNIRKGDLSNYVTSMVTARKAELRNQRDEKIKETLDLILPAYFESVNATQIEALADKLDDLFAPVSDSFSEYDYSWTSTKNDIRAYGIRFRQKIRDQYNNRLVALFKSPETYKRKRFEVLGEEPAKIVDAAVSFARELRNKETALETLQNELLHLIKLETTPKRAYNALVAQGVDMSGFVTTARDLPAVVKLSQPVCLLNNSCGDNQ